MGWRCVLLEETDTCRRWLRRYRFRAGDPCPGDPGQDSCCEAKVEIEDGPVVWTLDDDGSRRSYRSDVEDWPTADPRWPTACARCGRAFSPDDP